MDEIAKESEEIRTQALHYENTDMAKAVELYNKSIQRDRRNVLAYHNLAKIHLTEPEFYDIDLAEKLCKEAYEIKDIPPEITSAPVWLDDIHEEVNSDLDLLMMFIRIKQDRTDEARQYLNNIKAFYDKYSKGNYQTAKQIFDKHEQQVTREATAYASSRGSKSGCLSLLALLIVCLVASALVYLSK